MNESEQVEAFRAWLRESFWSNLIYFDKCLCKFYNGTCGGHIVTEYGYWPEITEESTCQIRVSTN